ncbi:MAG: pirin [Hymenobacter sp.]|nr:pirin [Hymenobacter sp.]
MAIPIMLLSDELLSRRFIWWNFVSSRRERIEQAKADCQAGRIALPPNDNAEFVPLPQDKARSAGSSPAPQALSCTELPD